MSAPASSSPPTAAVPDRLFADEATEQRWRQRFSAIRTSLAEPSRDDPGHVFYVSNATGSYQLYTWDVVTDVHQLATDRPAGTTGGDLTADGSELWWFDDTDGDEFGTWQRQAFGSAPGHASVAWPDVPPGYPCGLELGRTVRLAGFSDDDGARIYAALGEGAPTLVYARDTDASVGPLSYDETLWVLAHSEHGDVRYPALRALRVADGSVVGELDDTPGKGLAPLTFSPVPGDQRLLVGHERRGRDELLIWDVATGAVTELAIDLDGDLTGDFFPDGQSVLVAQSRAGRTRLHRFDLDTGVLTALAAAPGSVSGALVRPDGTVWYRWTDAAHPAELRQLAADGTDRLLLRAGGEPAPASLPAQDRWTDGPGGPIHSLIGYPDDGDGRSVFYVHGGPAAADEDVFDAFRATWLEAGFVVVQVNYRGSTGYGSAWRDALTERVGHVELSDIAAVYDDLVSQKLIDPSRAVISGGSWGGFLALLALGTQPDRWAAGVGAVPVADYLQAYADEMEELRSYDRALFGGSPDDKPDAYRDSSPLTYVDAVRAPVLIMAGENDPRCPIKQVENYLDALSAREKPFAVYRFDAGHGSLVVAERIRQVACEIAFVRDVVDRIG